MNVEFQIHGVLSSGQQTWKPEDRDYYVQFYSDRTEDVLMIIEIVKRTHGISTYYNYLRYNNVLSARNGSYFGMTMRIDGAFCRDVQSIYMIMDNLFNKMMVGALLVPKGDKYEYAIESFAAKNDYLSRVELQLSNMLSACCSSDDFFEVSSANTSLGTKMSINTSEVSIPLVVDTIKQRAKIYLSPVYQSKSVLQKIADAKAVADAAVANANAKIKTAEDALSTSKQEKESASALWKEERKKLQEDRDAAVRECEELKSHIRKLELNTSINANISEIRQPLTQLASLLTERFQEDADGNLRETAETHKEGRRKNKLFAWLPWALCALLAVAYVGAIRTLGKPDDSAQTVIKQKETEIEQLKDSISKMASNVEVMKQQNAVNVSKGSTPAQPTYDFNKLRINIIELESGAVGLSKGTTYTCEIKGGDYPKDGKWEIREGDKVIDGNKFTPSAESGTKVTITYYYADETVKQRTINIK